MRPIRDAFGSKEGTLLDQLNELKLRQSNLTAQFLEEIEVREAVDTRMSEVELEAEIECARAKELETTVQVLEDKVKTLELQLQNGEDSLEVLKVDLKAAQGQCTQLEQKASEATEAAQSSQAQQNIDNTEKAQAVIEKRQQKLAEELAALQTRKVELEQQHVLAAQNSAEAKAEQKELFQKLQAE